MKAPTVLQIMSPFQTRIKLVKLNACFTEPLAFFPFFIGLASIITSGEFWEHIGFEFLLKATVSTPVLLFGAMGYVIRWFQRKKPEKWALFIKSSAVIYLIMSLALIWNGSYLTSVFFLTMLFLCHKEIKKHLIFTKYHRSHSWK